MGIYTAGILYVVATPIGNLGDLSPRAQKVLAEVDKIAAEDTRHSRPMLQQFGIDTPMISLHEHNEREQGPKLIKLLEAGESIALISDAGTPLISDPGYHLVRIARESDIRVIPIPGPSALTAALSVSGLPTDHFIFEGFLPPKPGPRKKRLQMLDAETRTLVFYETPHRIIAALEDMSCVFGSSRLAVLARELTKTYETILSGTLGELLEQVSSDTNQQKGEFVVVIHGASPADSNEISDDAIRILLILMDELSVKQAAALCSRITGIAKNRIYKRALALGKKN
jgi:16S rRNA (cytidine1402-2'-O)-methyltransferase